MKKDNFVNVNLFKEDSDPGTNNLFGKDGIKDN
jgi:hypothetical protein